ncbi:MAG: hypothetical protein U0T84_04335 [Chitinophagales bacterium]
MKIYLTAAGLLLSLCLYAQTGAVNAKFKVQGQCEMCKSNIENSLKVTGVEAAIWNPDNKTLRIKYHPDIITLDSIHHRIALAGYDTDKEKAPDSLYQKLVKCCQYRKP